MHGNAIVVNFMYSKNCADTSTKTHTKKNFCTLLQKNNINICSPHYSPHQLYALASVFA